MARRFAPAWLRRQTHALIHEEVAFSAASVWELSIKSALGLLRLSLAPEKAIELLIDQGFRPLPVECEHALAVRHLPLLHKDPFDRMLVAQAQCESLTLVTADPLLPRYGVPTLDASA